MQTLIDKIYGNFFNNNGYHHIKNTDKPGYCYKLDECLGKGQYWIYPVNDFIAVTSTTARYKTSYSSNNFIPKCIGFGYFNASNPKNWYNSKINCKQQSTVIYGDESYCEIQVVPGDYISSKNIAILPEYYHERIEPLTSLSLDEFVEILSNTLTPSNEPPMFKQLMDSITSLPYESRYINLKLEKKTLEIIETVLLHDEMLKQFTLTRQANVDDIKKIHLVKSYIDKHFNQNIRIEKLIDIACMSRSKLQQLFKEKEGITITSYIQQQRTNSAKKLLVTSDLPLNLIAEHVGYTLHSSFSEIFKSRVGMTPSQFRKAFQIN